jgi:hypothetical protein
MISVSSDPPVHLRRRPASPGDVLIGDRVIYSPAPAFGNRKIAAARVRACSLTEGLAKPIKDQVQEALR